MTPLFLVRGWDYTERSAGQKLLHILAEKLSERGESVRMSDCKKRPGSTLKEDFVMEGRKIIVIEPEVIGGINPWSDLTVRWLLNVPGKTGPDLRSSWGKDDAIFHLCSEFSVEGSRPLSFGMVDHSIFNSDDSSSRTINCFYARKARFYSGEELECPEGFLDLSDATYSSKGLASIFRRTKKLVTMDLTCCSVEALLCGAEHEFVTSSYLPEPPVSDYLAWHEEMEKKSESRLTQFIEYCYDRVSSNVLV